MTKFNPCPFCGCNLISVGWTYSDRTVIGDKVILSCYYTIVCRQCGASMFIRMKNRDDSDDEDLPTIEEAARIAVERWNKRVIQ